MQKVPKIMEKWSPGGAFGSTLGTKNDPKAHKIQIFYISILHTDFRGPPGPHCGRNRDKITWQKQCLVCAGANGSHVGRFTKKMSGDHIFQRFWHRFGCQIEQLGPLCGHDGTFFAAGFGVVVGVMETTWKSPANHADCTSSQRAKSI